MRRSSRSRSIIDARVREIPFRVELPRRLEMALIVMRSIRIHIKARTLRDHRITPLDITNAFSRQTNGDDGPEAQRLFHQGCNVRDLLFD